MQYGPNSEQVEAYLGQVAALSADGWLAAAEALTDSPGLLVGASAAIESARSTATKNGLLGQVDVATREARQSAGTALDASTGLHEVLERTRLQASADGDPPREAEPRDIGMTTIASAVTSGATLLVLRPFLTDSELIEAWPLPSIDPQGLPSHVYVPPMGAVG